MIELVLSEGICTHSSLIRSIYNADLSSAKEEIIKIDFSKVSRVTFGAWGLLCVWANARKKDDCTFKYLCPAKEIKKELTLSGALKIITGKGSTPAIQKKGYFPFYHSENDGWISDLVEIWGRNRFNLEILVETLRENQRKHAAPDQGYIGAKYNEAEEILEFVAWDDGPGIKATVKGPLWSHGDAISKALEQRKTKDQSFFSLKKEIQVHSGSLQIVSGNNTWHMEEGEEAGFETLDDKVIFPGTGVIAKIKVDVALSSFDKLDPITESANASSESSEKSIYSLSKLVSLGSISTETGDNQLDDGVPYLRPENISTKNLTKESLWKFDPRTPEASGMKLKAGDIILPTTTTNVSSLLIEETLDGCLLDQGNRTKNHIA